jgi:hypothetical protein
MHRVTRTLALVASVTLFAALVATPLSAQQAPPAKNLPLIAMIDGFLKSPFSSDVRAAILDSAEARPDVMVSISLAVLPAMCYKDESTSVRALDALLLTAFVSGNMRAQLQSGTASDQVEAGLRGVIEVYNVIVAKVPNYHVPEVKEWIAAESEGKLGDVANRLAAQTRECRKKPARFPKNAQLAPQRP